MIRPLLLVLLATLAGCSAPDTPSAADVDGPSAYETLPPIPVGMVLQIPELGVDTPLETLHRDDAGVLVPPPVTEPDKVGWYAEGVLPGEVGPALIAGHVSGRPEGATESMPGIFARLTELDAGDRVIVVRGGEPLTFEIYQRGSYRKDEFPTEEVYGDRAGPELVLVTCGGAFDPAAHSYEENIVVFARLVP
jgi:sortase (surface protein transpeptidase)